ncbi:hypothetical protein FXW78_22560 [Rhodococcus opacus]|nr:hypothetical protein [Rhodococcus opacus]
MDINVLVGEGKNPGMLLHLSLGRTREKLPLLVRAPDDGDVFLPWVEADRLGDSPSLVCATLGVEQFK